MKALRLKVTRIYRARLETLAAAVEQQLGGFLTFRRPSGRHGDLGDRAMRGR